MLQINLSEIDSNQVSQSLSDAFNALKEGEELIVSSNEKFFSTMLQFLVATAGLWTKRMERKN